MAKRLKHIYNDIEHVFFHQAEFDIDWGKNKNGNMSFRGNKIYSYSSEIGIADFDRKVLYFRNGSYSHTTSKHQAAVRYAVPSDWKVFRWMKWHSFPYITEYVNERIDVLKEEKEKLYSNSKHSKYSYDSFLLGITELAEYVGSSECLTKFISEAEPYKRIEADIKHANIKEWVNDNNILGSWENKVKAYENLEFREKFLAKQEVLREKNKLKKEKALENLKKEFDIYVAEELEKWYNGESTYLGYFTPSKFCKLQVYRNYPGKVYLRISPKDPKTVITSKNVDIPLIECKFLYKKFRECIETNTEWHTNGEKYRIAKYQLEKIYKYGEHWYLHSGCHIIRDVEIEEFIDRFNLQSWRD